MADHITLSKRAFSAAEAAGWPLLQPAAEPSVPEPPSGQSWPTVSIVTPSFNQGSYLEKTIRSVLQQGYPNLEYIIIDGGSDDESVDIIKKYEHLLTCWVSEKDQGQSHAVNKGLAKTDGELLGWLNSDDYYMPGALFKLAKAYLDAPSHGAFYGQGHIINEQKKIMYTPDLVQVTRESLFEWMRGKNFMQPSCLFTRAAWKNCGPLDENIHIALDVDLWFKIADKYAFQQIDDLLSVALAHPGAKTTAFQKHMLVDLSFVFLKHGGEIQARQTLDELCDRFAECETQLIALNNTVAGRCGRLVKKILLAVKNKLLAT